MKRLAGLSLIIGFLSLPIPAQAQSDPGGGRLRSRCD